MVPEMMSCSTEPGLRTGPLGLRASEPDPPQLCQGRGGSGGLKRPQQEPELTNHSLVINPSCLD